MPPQTTARQWNRGALTPVPFAVSAAFLLLFSGVGAPAVSAQIEGPIRPKTTAPQEAPKAPPSAPDSIGGKPNLAGTWRMNKDQSDDLRKIMQQQSGNSGGQQRGGGNGRSGGGWGGRGGMGGGGMGGGIGGHGSGGQRPGGNTQGRGGANNSSGMDLTDFSRLTIEQSTTLVKVTGATGRILAQYSGGSRPADDDAYVPPAAEWQGEQLVVETPGMRGGRKTTRAYYLSPDGEQLFVKTRIEGPQGSRSSQPITFRFVYDLAKSTSTGTPQ